MTIFHDGQVVTQRNALPIGRIDTEFGLHPEEDQSLNASYIKLTLEVCFMEGIGSMFLDYNIALKRGYGRVDFPTWYTVLIRITSTTIVLDIQDGNMSRASSCNQAVDAH